jgi:hypothetical protein
MAETFETIAILLGAAGVFLCGYMVGYGHAVFRKEEGDV